MTLYCWGSTVKGELGLGGIEEEHVIYRTLFLKLEQNNLFWKLFNADTDATTLRLATCIKY